MYRNKKRTYKAGSLILKFEKKSKIYANLWSSRRLTFGQPETSNSRNPAEDFKVFELIDLEQQNYNAANDDSYFLFFFRVREKAVIEETFLVDLWLIKASTKWF